MQLRAEALEAHLAKSLAPLYVITSDEHLLALEAADKINDGVGLVNSNIDGRWTKIYQRKSMPHSELCIQLFRMMRFFWNPI
jgi:DNA polymerase III delta subunit